MSRYILTLQFQNVHIISIYDSRTFQSTKIKNVPIWWYYNDLSRPGVRYTSRFNVYTYVWNSTVPLQSRSYLPKTYCLSQKIYSTRTRQCSLKVFENRLPVRKLPTPRENSQPPCTHTIYTYSGANKKLEKGRSAVSCSLRTIWAQTRNAAGIPRISQ